MIINKSAFFSPSPKEERTGPIRLCESCQHGFIVQGSYGISSYCAAPWMASTKEVSEVSSCNGYSPGQFDPMGSVLSDITKAMDDYKPEGFGDEEEDVEDEEMDDKEVEKTIEEMDLKELEKELISLENEDLEEEEEQSLGAPKKDDETGAPEGEEK